MSSNEKQTDTLDFEMGETQASEFTGAATQPSHNEAEFMGGLDDLSLEAAPPPAPPEPEPEPEPEPQGWFARLLQSIARFFGGGSGGGDE